VNKKRQSSSLNSLETLVISLVADDADTEATISAATKMGSTGIRAWLAKRSTEKRSESSDV
jgi:16S rRNA U1498 N3-methylase RsmE